MNEQTLDIMTRVAKFAARRYNLAGCTKEDIEQEAYLMCLEAMPRFDGERSLETFLKVHVCNKMRMKIRDSRRLKRGGGRKQEMLMDESLAVDDADTAEVLEVVLTSVPIHLRTPLLRTIYDCRTNFSRKRTLLRWLILKAVGDSNESV